MIQRNAFSDLHLNNYVGKFKLFLNCSDFCVDDLFAELVPILRSALDGHNVCIFAYGKTGIGKNYTMVLVLV